jgi:glycosyltransferase involved in cell wall biosynthesis
LPSSTSFRLTQTVDAARSTAVGPSINRIGADLTRISLPSKLLGRTAPARVLIIESNEDGTVGGSHQVLFDLAKRLDRAHFEPVVLFNQDNVFVGRLRCRGIEVVVFDEISRKEREINRSGGRLRKLLGFGAAVVRRSRELARLRIDLVHLNNSPAVGNDNWLPAARMLGIPCVASAAGGARPPRRLIHRWLYRRFDVYLAASRYMAGILRSHGVNPDRIDLVYPGVDFDALHAARTRSRDSVRGDLGVGPQQLLVLMVGNIRPWKGQLEVIQALRLLPEDIRAHIRLFLAGATATADVEYEARLRREIAAAGLADCVTFLGSREDVADLYGAADIAVHASITPEPFGLVVVEAMAFNCAVIAASSGGPGEVITIATGMLCDPSAPQEYARALEQLVRDEELRRAIGAAASARAAVFNVERNVDAVSRAYRRALDRGRWPFNRRHRQEKADFQRS